MVEDTLVRLGVDLLFNIIIPIVVASIIAGMTWVYLRKPLKDMPL